MEHGLIILDKRDGITSAKAISEVKRRLNLKKIGHAGTLDPMATGLLVCLTGNATRCAHYATEGQKIYSGEILLGRVTTTDDVTGETVRTAAVSVSTDAIHEALKSFVGIISQIPPQFSALKINGQRAYDLAREGHTVSLNAREVTVSQFEVVPENDRIAFTVTCSPGTYIRSLARDLGEALGCGGCLSKLRRDASFPFLVKNAKLIDDLIPSDILHWCALFPSAPFISLPEDALVRLRGGDQRELKDIAAQVAMIEDGRPILFGGELPHGILLRKDGALVLGVYIG